MTLRESIGYRCQHAFANSRGHRATLQGSFARPLCILMRQLGVPRCSETRPFINLRKHPERRAATEMSLAPAVPAARSRRALPLTNGAQASFDCAHRRSRADALRSGCLLFLCALPRTRRFLPPFPLKAVRNSG